jgi:hypothetical protein
MRGLERSQTASNRIVLVNLEIALESTNAVVDFVHPVLLPLIRDRKLRLPREIIQYRQNRSQGCRCRSRSGARSQ